MPDRYCYLVMSTTCMPSSTMLATTAYVRPSILAVATSHAPYSTSNPPMSSTNPDTGTGE